MRDLLKQVAQPQGDNTTFIYGLVDPLTGYIRYIGKSDTPKLRYNAHLSTNSINARNHKAHWLRIILAQDVRPELVLIETVSKEDWECAERKWIAYYRSIDGFPPLTNNTSGGDGIDKGTKHSEETKRKMSASRMGLKISPETIEKRRAAMTGRVISKEWRSKISEANKRAWANFSEEQKLERVRNLHPRIKKEKPLKVKVDRRNKPKPPNCSSEFLGVTRVTIGKPYRSFATSPERRAVHLGCFKEEQEAARAYDRYIIAHYPEGAVTLNFPRSDYAGDDIPICLPDKQE